MERSKELLADFPKTWVLEDGTKAAVRPMVRQDRDRLALFFKRIGEDELRFLRDDVTDIRVIDRWIERLDYDRVLPLVADIKGRIIADASLHRRKEGWRRHLGGVRVVVDPAFRHRGLASKLIDELTAVARKEGLDRLYAEIPADDQVSRYGGVSPGADRKAVTARALEGPSETSRSDGRADGRAEADMQVCNWMTKKVSTVNGAIGLREAAELMKAGKIRHLPVVEGNRLIGIVTDRDLRQAMPPYALSLDVHEVDYLMDKVRVGDVMTKRVVGVSPDVSIAKAADLMVRNKIGCLPVLDGEALVGIITESDILRAVADKEAVFEAPLLRGKE
jgi:acetoin utilization protein AcuB